MIRISGKKKKIVGIDFSRKYICMECGCQKEPVDAKRGLWIIEILMWFMFIVPGVIYSIWRRLRKHKVCPNCMSPAMELTNSTRVMRMRRIINSFSPGAGTLTAPSVPQASSQSSSGAPGPKPKAVKKDVSQILKSSSRRGLKQKGQQGLIDFKPPGKEG